MAKKAICDECRKESELDGPYASVPSDWFVLRRSYLLEQHFCSSECLAAALAKLQAAPEAVPT